MDILLADGAVKVVGTCRFDTVVAVPTSGHARMAAIRSGDLRGLTCTGATADLLGKAIEAALLRRVADGQAEVRIDGAIIGEDAIAALAPECAAVFLGTLLRWPTDRLLRACAFLKDGKRIPGWTAKTRAFLAPLFAADRRRTAAALNTCLDLLDVAGAAAIKNAGADPGEADTALAILAAGTPEGRDILRWCVAAGAPVHAPSGYALAAGHGNPAIVHAILDIIAPVATPDAPSHSQFNATAPLVPVVERKGEPDLTLIDRLMALGCHPDERNWLGRTALHLACLRRKECAVEHLLAVGASPCIPANNGCLPIHFAAGFGNPEDEDIAARIIHRLVEHGSPVSPPEAGRRTPLVYAVRDQNIAPIRALIAAGAATGLDRNAIRKLRTPAKRVSSVPRNPDRSAEVLAILAGLAAR